MNDNTEARIQEVWENAVVIPYFDPQEIRADMHDTLIARTAYGNTKSLWGWQINSNAALHCKHC